MISTSRALIAATGTVLAALSFVMSGSAGAAETVRAGKTAPNALAFTPVDVGTAKGIWAKHGLKVETRQYGGDAKMQQGLVAGEIEFGLGSGPGMGFIAKGVPAKAVAVIANQPLSMGLIVRGDSKITKPEDLKGAKIGVTTNGSLTYWLARQLSRSMGWGNEGIKAVPLGRLTAQIAGLKSGQVDGFIMSASVGYSLAKKKEAKVLLHFGDKIEDFHTHVLFATNKVIEEKPNVVRAFIAGWKETVDFMRDNPKEAIPLANKATRLPIDVQTEEFGKVMPMMSRDMRFKPKALEVIADSFVELKILDKKPDMKTLYTEAFLPGAK
jgi:NitT/TauT family transport system substrate-binding protein